MRDTLGESLKKLKRTKHRRRRWAVFLLALSLVVTLDVFWVLRRPGLTMAGDASCGLLPVYQTAECLKIDSICGQRRHKGCGCAAKNRFSLHNIVLLLQVFVVEGRTVEDAGPYGCK